MTYLELRVGILVKDEYQHDMGVTFIIAWSLTLNNSAYNWNPVPDNNVTTHIYTYRSCIYFKTYC